MKSWMIPSRRAALSQRNQPTLEQRARAKEDQRTMSAGPATTTVVVTRHPALLQYLEELGLVPAGVSVLEQADPDDVRGRHVIGVLPLHLAALAEKVTVVPLDTPRALRGAELSIEQVRAFAGDPVTYRVTIEE